MTPCAFCGLPTPPSLGRTPRRFCSADCADAEKFLRAAEVRLWRHVATLRGQGTPEVIEASRRLRGRLWRAANALNVVGPPLAPDDGEGTQGGTVLPTEEVP